MGLSSYVSSAEGIQLCVFDSRRGHLEGQEIEKVLFFFPVDCPLSLQLSVVGLCDGLITFTRIFSPDAACDLIEADRHSHVFYQAEPDIWMVLVLEKSPDSDPIGRTSALQGVLKEVHSLFVMFFGSLRLMLDKHPDGGVVRSHLYFLIMDYLSDFLVGRKVHMPSFRDSLKERGTVQMLTMGREAAIEILSLVRLLESSCGGNVPCNSIVLFQDLLVSTSLPPEDTANLFSYAVLRLIPSAMSSGSSSWSSLMKGQVTAGTTLLHSSGSEQALPSSRDTSPARQFQQFVVPRPLQRDKWQKAKDGFLVTDAWGTEAGSMITVTPTVWLQQTGECMHLFVYQYKNLTVILLVSANWLVNGENGISLLKRQLLELGSMKIVKVEEKLSKGWAGINAYHVSGYRYLLLDNDQIVSRASPPGKVATLSKGSLLALSKLREQVDLEKKRAPNSGKDLEVCIRANSNAWIVARTMRGKELYMAMEKSGDTLLYAADAVTKFSDRYCDGAFSLD